MNDDFARTGAFTVPRRVLITDDDADFAASVVDALASNDYLTRVAYDSEGARAALADFQPGVALIDQRLGPSNGIDLCAELLAQRPELLCVMMTGYASVDTAIDAIKKGAYDYLRKPFDPDELLATVDRCFVRLDNERLRREHEQFHRTLFEQSPMGLVLSRIDGRIVDVNPAFAAIVGRSVGETIGLSPDELTPPEYAPQEESHLRGLQRDGRYGPFEKELLHEDGHRVPVRQSSMIIRRDGRPFVWSSVEDVSDMRAAERNLARSERDLRTTLDSIGDAVIATDPEGRVARMNPVASSLTGWPRAEAHGRLLDEVFHLVELESDSLLPRSGTAPGEGTPAPSVARQSILVSRHGERRRIAHGGAPIRDDTDRVTGMVITFRDVTEEHELQERLRHSQKMEAIGKLAGGVAHDFNNLLMVVLGNAELLREELGDDPNCGPLLGDIVHACQRAQGLTTQLLSFSRQTPLRFSTLDAHALIREVAQFLGRSIDRHIAIDLQLHADHSTVRADSSQLHHALLNLAVNAWDAMPDGGRLTIATYNTNADATCPQLAISVTDTGLGMSKEVMSRVFEPFFTTKSKGAGTGLGLASVYSCVQNHGGRIEVESEVGRGSAFRVFLDTVADAPPSTRRRGPSLDRLHGKGHVLVVDDEPLVRASLGRTLTRLGYGVTLTSDGAAALEALARDPRIDLVILDLAMPGMDGAEVFDRLREIDPALPVLLVSGFTEGEAPTTGLGEKANGFLAKPFSAERLALEVARHIRRRA